MELQSEESTESVDSTGAFRSSGTANGEKISPPKIVERRKNPIPASSPQNEEQCDPSSTASKEMHPEEEKDHETTKQPNATEPHGAERTKSEKGPQTIPSAYSIPEFCEFCEEDSGNSRANILWLFTRAPICPQCRSDRYFESFNKLRLSGCNLIQDVQDIINNDTRFEGSIYRRTGTNASTSIKKKQSDGMKTTTIEEEEDKETSKTNIRTDKKIPKVKDKRRYPMDNSCLYCGYWTVVSRVNAIRLFVVGDKCPECPRIQREVIIDWVWFLHILLLDVFALYSWYEVSDEAVLKEIEIQRQLGEGATQSSSKKNTNSKVV